MKPCGIILTFMGREDWIGKTWWIKLRTLFFNCVLFVFQLFFMIFATVWGKIKWPKAPLSIKMVSVCLMAICLWAMATVIFDGSWSRWLIPYWIFGFMFGLASFRGIDWRRVWRAAQCSHVRLVLERTEDEQAVIDVEWTDGHTETMAELVEVWRTANFGYPKMEIQSWPERWNAEKRFEYRDPTFPTPPEFMEPVIQYAEDQVGKRYDEVQLASPVVNLPLWMFYPPWWGQEKIKAFNRSGGLEYCVSGVVADLRWGEAHEEDKEFLKVLLRPIPPNNKRLAKLINMTRRLATRFFPGYDPAVIPPCLVALSKNWEEQ